MDTIQPTPISIVDPISTAIDKTKQILFQPFDISKWFAIGFCAWLATLGDGGGSGGNFNFGAGNRSGGGGLHQEINNIKDAILENLPIIIFVGAVVFVLIMTLSFLFMWLKSRGQFMFLHCVARNVAEVKNPWTRYAKQANSLFLFRVLLWLAGMIAGLFIVVPIILLIIPMAKADFEIVMFGPIMGIVLLVLGAIVIGIVFGIVHTLTKDFVVPVMYLHGFTVTQGWRTFWQLCSANMSKFILFLLFLFVVNMGIGMLILILMLATCCCAACFLAIPYIGTVLMLPLLVWRRAYSALFLAQFGPAFDVFIPETDPVVTPSENISASPPSQDFE